MIVALTGSTGFIGSQVLRRLEQRAVDVRALVRVSANTRALADRPTLRRVVGDLRDGLALADLVVGADVVVHCGHAIDGDQALLTDTNDVGTLRLLEASRAAGISRVLTLGTAAVYGRGPHRGIADGLRPAPVSTTSISRLAADTHTLQVGGVVIRPHLVIGAGDRWAIPGGIRALELFGWVDGGTSRHSVIHVRDLATAITDLALADGPWPAGEVLHAAHPFAPSMRQLLVGAAPEAAGRPWPWTTPASARHIASSLGERAVRLLELSALDHVFDSGPLWNRLGWLPQSAPADLSEDDLRWYQAFSSSSAPPVAGAVAPEPAGSPSQAEAPTT